MKAKEIIQIIFSAIILLATLVWFGMLFYVTVPTENRTLIDMAAGVFLGSGYTQILNWWFGSSKGSSDKTDTINKQAEILAQNTTSKTTETTETKITPTDIILP